MGYEYNLIKGSIVTLIFFGIFFIFLIKLDLIDIEILPSPFDDRLESFEQSSEKRAMISALRESMPLLAQSVISNPELDDSQVKSLKLLYLPLVNDFVKTRNPELIKKSLTIKNLIVNGELRAKKSRSTKK